MDSKNLRKYTDSKFIDFLDCRKKLSSFDKKLELGIQLERAEAIDIEKPLSKVSTRINRKNKIQDIYLLITKFAAILTLPLMAFTIWLLFFHDKKEVQFSQITQNEITWQEINCPQGMRSYLILPDGTNLWLNSGSKLKYSIPFTGNTREVELEGEAFLDVFENRSSPFVVRSGNYLTEVTGTQFNIKSYAGSNRIEVALKEGGVKFRSCEQDKNNQYCELKENDYLIFFKNSGTYSIDSIDIEKFIAWHKNIMILDETPMEDVARLLEQWYGVKVILGSDEIKKYKFTTTFDNEPLFRVLELLELSSPLTIHYTPGKLDEATKKPSPSIVTITKK